MNKENISRFKSHFGSNPDVYACIWEDLQLTENPEAQVDAKDMDIDAFLIGIHFLKRYPTAREQAGIFKICEKTARKYSWNVAKSIQALKSEKVRLFIAYWLHAIIIRH
jgi:hypothetical protein